MTDGVINRTRFFVFRKSIAGFLSFLIFSLSPGIDLYRAVAQETSARSGPISADVAQAVNPVQVPVQSASEFNANAIELSAIGETTAWVPLKASVSPIKEPISLEKIKIPSVSQREEPSAGLKSSVLTQAAFLAERDGNGKTAAERSDEIFTGEKSQLSEASDSTAVEASRVSASPEKLSSKLRLAFVSGLLFAPLAAAAQVQTLPPAMPQSAPVTLHTPMVGQVAMVQGNVLAAIFTAPMLYQTYQRGAVPKDKLHDPLLIVKTILGVVGALILGVIVAPVVGEKIWSLQNVAQAVLSPIPLIVVRWLTDRRASPLIYIPQGHEQFWFAWNKKGEKWYHAFHGFREKFVGLSAQFPDILQTYQNRLRWGGDRAFWGMLLTYAMAAIPVGGIFWASFHYVRPFLVARYSLPTMLHATGVLQIVCTALFMAMFLIDPVLLAIEKMTHKKLIRGKGFSNGVNLLFLLSNVGLGLWALLVGIYNPDVRVRFISSFVSALAYIGISGGAIWVNLHRKSLRKGLISPRR